MVQWSTQYFAFGPEGEIGVFPDRLRKDGRIKLGDVSTADCARSLLLYAKAHWPMFPRFVIIEDDDGRSYEFSEEEYLQATGG